jgi:hypothetical protein
MGRIVTVCFPECKEAHGVRPGPRSEGTKDVHERVYRVKVERGSGKIGKRPLSGPFAAPQPGSLTADERRRRFQIVR